MKSTRAIGSSKTARRFKGAGATATVGVCLAALSAAAVWFFFAHGWLLWYGDAEAHLNTARRIIDSQTPGYDQLGTPWLPLLHVLLLPFVRVDRWWYSGIAAAFPSAAFFVAGGLFLFAAARRILGCTAAATAAAALAVLNPNLLYLQSTAMTEAIFFGCLMTLLYFSVREQATGAGLAACAAALTRYEGWFLIPFVAAYFLLRRRWTGAAIFTAIAATGPLYWVAHNWYLTGDPFDFYRGPYSPLAIQGNASYPGMGDWRTTWLYYRTAVRLAAGTAITLAACGGAVVLLFRRHWWPLALLVLPGAFFVWSIHRGVVPIFVPVLWPNSYYNTRYGVAVLPLLALAASALVTLAPPRWRTLAAALLVLACTAAWILDPRPETWVTWAESRANSQGRRAWTGRAAKFLKPRFVPGSGIIASSGDDFSGIFREMEIPLRDTFSVVNGLPYLAAVTRPDLFLTQEWAVVKGGDDSQSAVNRAGRYGIRYDLELTIVEKNEPVIEIYRRRGEKHGSP